MVEASTDHITAIMSLHGQLAVEQDIDVTDDVRGLTSGPIWKAQSYSFSRRREVREPNQTTSVLEALGWNLSLPVAHLQFMDTGREALAAMEGRHTVYTCLSSAKR